MPKHLKKISFQTKTAAANLLGVDRATFTAWSGKPDFPGGVAGPWVLSEVMPWVLARQRRGNTGDPLFDGSDSPALERYREARAALSELELAQRAGQLLDKAKTKNLFSRLAGIIRKMGERLSKKFGNDAASMLNDCLREFESIVNFELGSNDGADDLADPLQELQS